MSEAVKPAAPVARGTIHDLGYKRYLGTRRPQSTRWRVITRHQLAQAWKTWWRYKAWVGIAVLITVGVGTFMAFMKSDRMGDLSRNGVVVRLVDEMVFGSIRYYTIVAFLVSLTIGAGVIASDLRTGAFTFYFARPVRTFDYVLGKLVGLFTLQATVILAPLLVIVLVRLGLSKDTDELIRNLALLPKMLLLGTLASLGYAASSLGFSSMLPNPRHCMALWAGWYILLSTMFTTVAMVTKNPALGCVDIVFALTSLSFELFGVQIGDQNLVMASMPAALTGLLGWIAAGVGIAYWRVKSAGHAGIGGAS